MIHPIVCAHGPALQLLWAQPLGTHVGVARRLRFRAHRHSCSTSNCYAAGP